MKCCRRYHLLGVIPCGVVGDCQWHHIPEGGTLHCVPWDPQCLTRWYKPVFCYASRLHTMMSWFARSRQ
jgi:hypothetical protein